MRGGFRVLFLSSLTLVCILALKNNKKNSSSSFSFLFFFEELGLSIYVRWLYIYTARIPGTGSTRGIPRCVWPTKKMPALPIHSSAFFSFFFFNEHCVFFFFFSLFLTLPPLYCYFGWSFIDQGGFRSAIRSYPLPRIGKKKWAKVKKKGEKKTKNETRKWNFFEFLFLKFSPPPLFSPSFSFLLWSFFLCVWANAAI